MERHAKWMDHVKVLVKAGASRLEKAKKKRERLIGSTDKFVASRSRVS